MSDQPPGQVFCPSCKGGNPPSATHCQWCRAPLQATQPEYQRPQQNYQQYQAPPMPVQVLVKPKRSPVLMIALILIGICVVLGIIGAATNSRRPITTNNPLTTSQIDATNAAKVPTIAGVPANTPAPPLPTDTAVPPTPEPGIGTTVEVGSWKVTVEKVETAKEIDWSDFGNKETAKGKFILVYADVENVSGKTDSVKSFDWKLEDGTGAVNDTWTDFAYYSFVGVKKVTRFNEDVPPRTTAKLLAMFDVATDATDLTLVIEGKARIVLGTP